MPVAATPVKAAETPVAPAEINLNGRVEAQHVVAVGAQVTGTIAEVLVDAGQEVFAGEVLARVSNLGLETARDGASRAVEVAQARLEKAGAALVAARLEATRARADATRARTELDRAERTLERQRMLNREGATPRLVYEKAQRDFEQAQAQAQSLEDLARVAQNSVDAAAKEQESARATLDEHSKDLEEAKAQLQIAEVRAPVDGTVVERKGEAGTAVGPQELAEMFRIAVDLGELQVVVTPDAETVKRLQTGDPAVVTVAEAGAEGIAGSVSKIEGGTVTVSFGSADAAVKPGMAAAVRIPLK